MLVIVAWILSAAFASPILHFYNTTETGHYTCRDLLDRWVITLVSQIIVQVGKISKVDKSARWNKVMQVGILGILLQ